MHRAIPSAAPSLHFHSLYSFKPVAQNSSNDNNTANPKRMPLVLFTHQPQSYTWITSVILHHQDLPAHCSSNNSSTSAHSMASFSTVSKTKIMSSTIALLSITCLDTIAATPKPPWSHPNNFPHSPAFFTFQRSTHTPSALSWLPPVHGNSKSGTLIFPLYCFSFPATDLGPQHFFGPSCTPLLRLSIFRPLFCSSTSASL